MREENTRRGSMTVIFKGSNRCNAGCKFCSVGIPGGKIIDWEDVERVAEQLERLVAHRRIDRLEFTFHGGEPTLLGAELIDRICARVRRIPAQVGFSMQSNLLHCDDDIIEVLKRYEVRVGSSIDPICSGRLDGAGKDAFPTWLENYLRLHELGFEIGAIVVVTRQALGEARRLDEVAESISSARGRPFGLQINPVYAQGKAAGDASVLITPHEFGEFLVDIWRIWEESGRTVSVSPVKAFAQAICGAEERGTPLSCSFNGDCSRSHVGLDFDLNVAGCGRRLDSGAFFGNLRDGSLVEILDGSEEKGIIARRSDELHDGACKGCRFFPLCHGGCPDDADLGGRIRDRFEWCESYRMLFEAMEASCNGTFFGDERTVVAAVEPARLAERLGNAGHKEAWLIPSRDARNLRFESGLQELGGFSNTKLKIWVHNGCVNLLSLWEKLVQRPNVSVVLFEAEGLEAAAAFLNDLGAHAILDMASLAATEEGTRAAGAVLERFLFDTGWRSRVSPFDGMLLSVVRGNPVRPGGWIGLHPGRYRVFGALVGEGAPQEAIDFRRWMEREEGSLADWLGSRGPCLECPHLDTCGACMAPGDGRPCPDAAKAVVKRIEEVGATMREQMGAR